MSGWGSLRALLAEARSYRGPAVARVAGTDCPIDGTRLLPAPGGGLYCPFDGWRGSPFQAEVAGPSHPYDRYTATYTSTY